MRQLVGFTILIFLFLIASSPSQAQDKIEVFGGYSFVHAPVTYTESCSGFLPCPPFPTTSPHINMSGWEFSGAYKIFGPLALAGDFTGDYGSFHGASTHLQTYLFGPQIRLPGPISPFAHVLVGAAHEAIGTGDFAGLVVSGPTQNALAMAVGVGIDVKVLPFISIRPIQLDYLVTRFNNGTQNQPRASAGVVLHF